MPTKKSPSDISGSLTPKIIRAPRLVKSPSPAKPKAVSATTITALVDVGYGNSLYVRGHGPGLSWEKGVPLNCLASAHWTLALDGASQPVEFKFLVNDQTWHQGDNYAIQPGTQQNYSPAF